MSEKIKKLRAKTLAKIVGSQISESEAEKIKKLIPTTKDSESVFEAKKNSLLMKIDSMKVGGEMLKGNQKKLDKNKDGKISGEDFKMMKNKAKKGKMMYANMGMEAKSTQGYGAARTSGMGLQDEQLPPGKSLDYYKDIM